jgi:hypothetical protein
VVRQACEAEVLEYQRKMEDMQGQFTHMLRETLDKVGHPLAGGMVVRCAWRESVCGHARACMHGAHLSVGVLPHADGSPSCCCPADA